MDCRKFWAVALILFIAAVMIAGAFDRRPAEVPVVWDGDRPSCPAGYSATAEQTPDDHDTAVCSKEE